MAERGSEGSIPGVVHRIRTGVPGFDALTRGGLPQGRAALLAGTSGSGKTVFASQFLFQGIREHGEPGVFVSFEETADQLRSNFASFGWDIQKYEDEGKWLFVDASRRLGEEDHIDSGYDLGGLVARMKHAIERSNAKRVVLDSVAALFLRFPDVSVVRREMFRITASLKNLGVTALITGERLDDYGQVTRHGVEEYVVDSVVILRNALDSTRRRRTIEVLKMRGCEHSKGEFPLAISDEGMRVIPLDAIGLNQPTSMDRVTSGQPVLDEMCGGGLFRDSVTIVSGATGTGKTLTATHFIDGARQQDHRVALFGFEESRSQLVRNANAWGIDIDSMERSGHLRLHVQFPESGSLEDHLVNIQKCIRDYQPHRLVVDSITALQRVASDHGFREFIISLTAMLKEHEIAGLYTSTSDRLFGSTTVTDQNISTIADTIVLLRYIEQVGTLNRGLAILKMRGSHHDRRVRLYDITENGLALGEPVGGFPTA